ncbi:hypothetical protein [Cognatiluteimonas weifangensis]|uniref:hypothetical protein n=1 Tax=Cognatiluteimonas weifangensis TaxID=2303539 RepID=UPI0018F257A1|nr:hypothetical protein [Luteimonas weifangensis]
MANYAWCQIADRLDQDPLDDLRWQSLQCGRNAFHNLPLSEHPPAEHPLTLYAARKKAARRWRTAYVSLYAIPGTGLRSAFLHRVWALGWPAAAIHGVVPAHQGHPGDEPIKLFNNGRHKRRFTYVNDRGGRDPRPGPCQSCQ